MVPVQWNGYQMVSAERTYLQLGLCESSAAGKGITTWSGASWAIKISTVTTTSQVQGSFPTVFFSEIKGRMYFHPYSFESTARQRTPSLILSMAKAENSLKSLVNTISVCCSWGLGHLVTFEQLSCLWVANILETEPPSPASPHEGNSDRQENSNTPASAPHTDSPVTSQELQMKPKVILWGNNQKRSWLTHEKVQPRLRISKDNEKENKIPHNWCQ